MGKVIKFPERPATPLPFAMLPLFRLGEALLAKYGSIAALSEAVEKEIKLMERAKRIRGKNPQLPKRGDPK